MTWDDFIKQEMEKDYFRGLSSFLAADAKSHTIYPPKERVFAAFDSCPLEKVKCLILGMDPYHTEGAAHGLSFSVPRGKHIPPSLRNIFRELRDDLGIAMPTCGDLTPWSAQGVLLLNAALTVREGEAGSHRGHGWEEFSDAAIRLLNTQDRPFVSVLWGNDARAKKRLLTNPKCLVIEGIHPSPLANTGKRTFFGGKYFSRANQFLIDSGVEPIDWRLP